MQFKYLQFIASGTGVTKTPVVVGVIKSNILFISRIKI